MKKPPLDQCDYFALRGFLDTAVFLRGGKNKPVFAEIDALILAIAGDCARVWAEQAQRAKQLTANQRYVDEVLSQINRKHVDHQH